MPHLPRNPVLRIGPWENTVQHSQNLIRPTALGSTWDLPCTLRSVQFSSLARHVYTTFSSVQFSSWVFMGAIINVTFSAIAFKLFLKKCVSF